MADFLAARNESEHSVRRRCTFFLRLYLPMVSNHCPRQTGRSAVFSGISRWPLAMRRAGFDSKGAKKRRSGAFWAEIGRNEGPSPDDSCPHTKSAAQANAEPSTYLACAGGSCRSGPFAVFYGPWETCPTVTRRPCAQAADRPGARAIPACGPWRPVGRRRTAARRGPMTWHTGPRPSSGGRRP